MKRLNQILYSACALILLGGIPGCSELPVSGVIDSAGISPADQPAAVAAERATRNETASSRKESAADGESSRPTSRMYKGTGQFVKAPAAASAAQGPADITLNFEAADVRDIAKTVLAEIFKESYIVDPKVQGTISFRTARPLARDALLPTLETVLRMNGIVMVKENGVFKIMPAATAKGSLSPQMGAIGAGFTLQVVPLSYIGAREMTKLLESVAADPSLVKADELRNLLIIAGTQNEIRHLLDTIEMFDVDWMSGMSVGLYSLQSADVKTVDQDLKKVFSEKNDIFAGVLRLIPIERLNAFVIITTQPKYLEQAKVWLERFDRVGGSGGTRLFVYHVQNSKAEHLAELLNQMFSSQKNASATRTTTPARVAPGLTGTELNSGSTTRLTTNSLTGQTQGLGSLTGTTTNPANATAGVVSSTLTIGDDSGGTAEQVRVVADPQNNALLILANSAGYEKIESALKKLDAAPRQVLIEVMIGEVTLKDDLSYGVEWLFTNGARRSGQLDTGSAGLNKLVPGFSYAITSATSGNITGVLNMLATDKRLNILSSPHILVADNQTAKIQVGDSVPTAGPQSVTGTGNIISSVQYLDTGVILSVTPRINASGLVNLDILQEVSTAAATTTSGLNSPTISRRAAKTALAVQSGETIVMGGLISEQSSNENSGLPFLSSIPVVGGLFGTQAKNRSRTELILLITPRVANNFNQAKTLSDELRRKMGEVKDLMDCGTTNVLGYSSRSGLWCLQPGRSEGTGGGERRSEAELNPRAFEPPPREELKLPVPKADQ